jgi:hemolysin D
MDQCGAAGRTDCVGPESLRLFREVEAQGIARQRTYRDALRTERALETQAEEELLGARAQLVKLEQLLSIIAEEDASLADLARQGLVPKFQRAEKQRARIETEQNLASQHRTVTSLESRLAESRSRLARVTSEYRQELLTEQVEAQGALNKAREELAKQRHREVLNELRAPQDGIIKDVATYTVGAVVAAGTVLMTLVPSDEDLVAEVFIRNEDVGFVREGQSVKVKLAAYPFQKYGMIDGVVSRIAADAVHPQANREQETGAERVDLSPYKAVVQLRNQTLGEHTVWPLAPGMEVAAEIREGQRTVLEYLLSPVSKAAHEAGRER